MKRFMRACGLELVRSFFVMSFLLPFAAVAFGQVPQISLPLVPSSIAPGGVPPAGPGFSITVNGTGFTPSSIMNWNGSPRQTTFVSSTKLRVLITAEDVELPGTAWVTVSNPTPGGASNVAYFEVTDPTLSISFSATAYTTGTGPVSVAVGDFNGDGRLDLAVADSAGTVSVLFGNGDGSFQPAVNYTLGSGPVSIVVGDFNGDGKVDLVAVNTWDNDVSVLLGNGDGTFQPAVNYAVENRPLSVALGDFNGDGKMDLAVANMCGSTSWNSCSYFTPGSISILLGNGDGTFQPAVNYGVGPWPGSVAVGDFNGDGKPDLAASIGGQTNSVAVLLGNGDGTFQAPTNYRVSGVGGVEAGGSVAVGDFNGDGKLDLAVADAIAGVVGVLLGNGDGTFQSPVTYTTGLPFSLGVNPGPSSVEVVDLNGDGKPDLLVANVAGTNASVFLGNGDGTFQGPANYTVDSNSGSSSSLPAFGDFNGDGRMDVVIPDGRANSVFVLLQPTPTGGLAEVNGGNVFTGNQTVNGSVSATSFIGNGSGLTGVSALTAATAYGLGCTGCVGNTQLSINYAAGDAQGGNALNALMLGGFLPGAFAPASGSPNYAPTSGSTSYVAKAGDTMSGTLNLPANGLVASGNQFVLAGGKVGIGTSSPSAPLHVHNGTSNLSSLVDGNMVALFENTGGGATNVWLNTKPANAGGVAEDYYFEVNGVGTGGLRYNVGGDYVALTTDTTPSGVNSEPFVLKGRNVGIGTISPSAQLDVNGTANFSGLVTFAHGQTFPGAGNGTITGVTAGTGLSGGGTNGSVTLSLNTSFTDTRYLSLAGGTLSGSLTSPSFAGNGASLTALNPANLSAGTASININGNAATAGTAANSAALGGAPAANYAPLLSPGFTGTPTAPTAGAGTNSTQLATTAYVNNPNNIYSGWHQAEAIGTFQVTPTDQGKLITAGGTNVMLPASIPPLGWWIDVENHGPSSITVNPNGNNLDYLPSTITLPPNQGLRIVSSGLTYFTQRGTGSSQSMMFALSVPSLKPGTCSTSTFTFTGASDGDTTALGVPNALMVAGIITYSGWVSAANSVSIRACDFNPNGPATAAVSGTVRVDIWKH